MPRLLTALVLLTCLASPAAGQTKPAEDKPAAKKSRAPESPPPRWVRVRMDDDHQVRVREFVIAITVVPQGYRQTVRINDEVGTQSEPLPPPVGAPKAGQVIISEQVNFIPLDDFQAVTAGGKTLSRDELFARLEKDTLALLTDGKVDPYYLPAFKEDTIILTSPKLIMKGKGPGPIGQAKKSRGYE